MQEQFENENMTEVRVSSEENVQTPFEGVAFDEEAAERARKEAEERARKEEAKSKLRFAANRLGWATVILVAVWMGVAWLASDFVFVLEGFGALDQLSFSSEAFNNRFALIINELALAVGIAVATLVLTTVQRVELNKEKISAGRFMKILVMCFGASYIGNMIGTRILSFWNLMTDNSAGDELITLLETMDPWMMGISVGILAPILEELFFRKFLTERLRVFGERTAILLPAFLFALFHQSAEQIVYAFAVGIILGYCYCRTGNYWLSVLIHAVFNLVSGVIPVLFLPKINEFLIEFENVFVANPEVMDFAALWEMLQPMLENHGAAIALYALYSLIILAINITGLVMILVSLKKFKARGGEYALTFKESAKVVFKTPGMIVCTVGLGITTLISLFA